ncbi:hypothetical protein QFC22_002371 [Naganishia vaughanmartiniae]|uniref:Uncharacterized protein n=1 Tax=Naganishia vaughanmartiniae TaxID=1424756 RepID=A0ACC2XCJ2_9TREE|nr:hypothetical protein QFC22_002371 [Naganishia vaughanmartiniae]
MPSSHSSHRHRHRSPEPQPPSTLKVLSYVAFVWFAWGIFTRLDETDHLRPPAPLRQAAHAASSAAHYAGSALHQGERAVENGYDGLRGAWDDYQGLQKSDNGIYSLSFPKSSISDHVYRSQGSNIRGWFGTIIYGISKTITYLIIYPSIILFNIASFLLHYISVTFLMLLTTAYYVAYPLHQILNMVFSTFTAPMGLVWALFRWTEPLWTLFGGLLGVGATMGGGFAWIAKKMEREVYLRNEEKQEQERVQLLEWEIEQREMELERERRRADEQEKKNLLLQLQGVRNTYRSPLVVPPTRNIIAALFDKVVGRNVSFQDRVDEYYADMELLEPPYGAVKPHTPWQIDPPKHHHRSRFTEEVDSGEEEERELLFRASVGQRMLLAPAESGSLKKRIRHTLINGDRGSYFSPSRQTARHQVHPVPSQQILHQHHHYRFAAGPSNPPPLQQHSGRIDSQLRHGRGDPLPAMHIPPVEGLPPTPHAVSPTRSNRQPFMTFPAGNLVRAGMPRTHGRGREEQLAGNGLGKNSTRRISFADVDEDALARVEVEQEPVEGEMFGLAHDDDDDDDDLEGEEDSLTAAPEEPDETNERASADTHEDQMVDAEHSPSGTMPPSIHLHFHNQPATSMSGPNGAVDRRKRTLRFQEATSSAPADTMSPLGTDYAGEPGLDLQDKYGTPFKRSSARVGKQLKHAFEQEGSLAHEPTNGSSSRGMLFGQAGAGRRSSSEQADLYL